MDKLGFAFYQEEDKRKAILQDFPNFCLSGKIESHHIFGKINSDEEVPIDKVRHALITSRINILPKKWRSVPQVNLVTNLGATLELGSFELRHYSYLLRHPEYDTEKYKHIMTFKKIGIYKQITMTIMGMMKDVRN